MDEARSVAEALARANARDFNALHLLGTIAVTRGEAEQCVRLYDRALEIEPRHAEALCNRGIAFRMLGQPQRALEDYDRAIAADPGSFNAHTLRGVLLAAMNRQAEARAAYDRALALKAGYPAAVYNRGLQDLAAGRFAEGWDAYELRFVTQPPTAIARSFGLPRLESKDLGRVKHLALWREQGLGDQILFSTLLPELRSRGIEAVVEADPRLVPAFSRSFPGFRFVTPEEAPKAFETCDFELPLGSLPRLFRRSAESFARQPRALLAPDPARLEAMRSQPGVPTAVGISWRSIQARQRRLYGDTKSIPLEHFGVLAAADCRLLDLQYGDVAEERAAFDARYPGARIEAAGLDTFNDLEGMFAAIAACRLLVTTSNVTAHFAGAIGKPTWLVYLAAQPPFHYWVPGPDGRSRWYPSVEILTHPGWTTWEAAFTDLARKLQRLGGDEE